VPRAPHLQNLLFYVLTSHQDLAPTLIQGKEPFQFFIHPLLNLIFEFDCFLLIHHVDPRLQKRLQIFHRQVSGEISRVKARSSALAGELEAHDLRLALRKL
jgi:hypothetical protein